MENIWISDTNRDRVARLLEGMYVPASPSHPADANFEEIIPAETSNDLSKVTVRRKLSPSPAAPAGSPSTPPGNKRSRMM